MTHSRIKWLVCVGLALLVWTVFGQARSFSFVSYDDPVYVAENSNISDGLSFRSIAWAFTHSHAENWHPLTTISHMLDAQFFGLNSGAHHVVSVLLHAVAAILLFLWLGKVTGRMWCAAFVATIFAIHPLRAESVAWIAERKDVLSGVFLMLTLLAYTRYARQRSFGSMSLAAVVFACGLMSKPMLVTVPAVLLLLDVWPFGRIDQQKEQRTEDRGRTSELRGQSLAGLIMEKIPFFALSALSAVITILVQKTAVSSLETLPLKWRIENAVVSCVTYLGQLFWPAKLAAFYPHPQGQLALWQVTGATLLILALTVIAFVLRKTHPYLLVGWLWYLVMLLPVIGVLQVGLQAHADRYTYLPLIGPIIAITWFFADLVAARRSLQPVMAIAAVLIIASFTFVAHTQASYWQNSETLWEHALVVTKDNDVAHNNLGNVFLNRENFGEAVSHFQKALNIRTQKGESQFSTGAALSNNNLGIAFTRMGRVAEGVAYYRRALGIWPEYADAHYNLGTALFEQGQMDEAMKEWNKTLAIHPQDAGAHSSMGNALLQKGAPRDAIAHYEMALQTDPNAATASNNLAWVLATHPDNAVRNGTRAIELAQRAVHVSGGRDAAFIRTLAAAYAEAGRFAEAVETAQRGLEMTQRENNAAGASAMQSDLELYRAQRPLRDSSLTNAQ